MLDYDREAAQYDASRGGDARASAAAEAIDRLLPASAGVLVDVAGGTGIVSARLNRRGRRVLVIDASASMTAVAARRLPGQVARADAVRLPLRDGTVDAVTFVWFLHLLDPDTSAVAMAEACRVLRPGGILVTTVNKNQGHQHTPNDAADLVAAHRTPRPAADDANRVIAMAARHGLIPAGDTTFVGIGQGRTPREWRAELANGSASLLAALAALPDQDRPRPDPTYRLLALIKLPI